MLRVISAWLDGTIANDNMGLRFVRGTAPLICRLFRTVYDSRFLNVPVFY